MNRRERRKLSKRLGIMDYQRTLPLNKKFELIRENIIAGHKKEVEVKEEIRRRQALTQEERDNEALQALAQIIEKEEEITATEALEKAQKMYYKGRKK